MPRLVRRTPWIQRVKAKLNPMDFLLWLSEELETRDWDSKALGTQLGLGFNFLFLIARANSATSGAADDVFSDNDSSSITVYLVYRRPFLYATTSRQLLTIRYSSGRSYGFWSSCPPSTPITR